MILLYETVLVNRVFLRLSLEQGLQNICLFVSINNKAASQLNG